MAHLWQEDPLGRWDPVAVSGDDGTRFHASGPRGAGCDCGHPTAEHPAADDAPDTAREVSCRVVPTGVPGSEWAVVAPPGDPLWVNGTPVSLGLRVLADRDELAVFPPGGAAVRRYFSTEEAVCVVPYPAGEKPVRCPRCKKEITEGTPVVRCPNPQCRAWHHQIPAGHEKHKQRECWTYAEKCALCSQTTALDAGFRWTPHDL